ncbi:hypothetical protein SPRG_08582 [Saprolegnia parasitica CBS 223.65]|uniref:Uncharacterized protein n=1 Tax=Saprolegnia parasitica (strain CBS 223.65) TaxID=695850 RepID=A0A067CAP6_SAPPC|nr:hypothetical protein SPRG_08582 [Saprolegnia parasitica CBS 223.65]KDO26220.1 hypothetical protein SPRG_08582 [Saprolegnia parasitica CBS 223.65]|eukprot:XP_012203212.1 hypothetical protein SPRG_08582 [Saprolegnia parasitica CBS 223.65]
MTTADFEAQAQRPRKKVDAEKARMRNKAYYAANKEKIAAKKKAYRAANTEAIAANRKALYEKNREREREQSKEYRQGHKKATQASSKSWHAANRAYKNARDQAHRARKKALAAGETPPPMPKLVDFRTRASGSVGTKPSMGVATLESDLSDEDDHVPHPLAVASKPIVMVSFTDENPFNMRKRGPEPCCDECALFQPNALTSATNTVLLAGTYQCTFCRDWTYYRLHRKHKRTRADARLDALTA